MIGIFIFIFRSFLYTFQKPTPWGPLLCREANSERERRPREWCLFDSLNFSFLISLLSIYLQNQPFRLRKLVTTDKGLASSLSGIYVRYLIEDAFRFDLQAKVCVTWSSGVFFDAKYERSIKASTPSSCLICALELIILYFSVCSRYRELVSCSTSRYRDATGCLRLFLLYLIAPVFLFSSLLQGLNQIGAEGTFDRV